ncbi:glycosyltransferase family 2 protein [Streptacidiphilus jiangxiensis]|uniref:Glycosyl transferase family 2 n=1 Tax=Streptacidiphilus jiangxiensis TaxID=235985 RepID=A0A1H7XJE9_STRJI|nr:glycosyltransferase [Streptacidiphilus jiangxiensis]SEM33783.1 Glycosyl transferase family 2 [Streptacidiphilus jiangxiensis]
MSSVSVVIPCYKYGHYLEDCVRSVLDEQPGVDVRVLIIDDASPDDSAEAARKLAAQDDRIEVRVHERNRGHIATYNEGLLEWADGDYCALLSADDRLVPGALTRAAALLDAHPEAGFCYGRPIHFQHGRPLPAARTGTGGQVVYPGHWWLERRFREGTGCITSPEVVVRTSLQRRIGGYDPELPHAGDIEMWMRLAAHADVGYVSGADQAYYRVHGQNMSTTDFGGQLDDLRQRLVAYESALAKCGDRLPDADRLGEIVHRRLARHALRRAYRAYDRGRTDAVPVDELVDFARACTPDAEALPEFRALRLRRRIGTTAMPYLQPLVLSAVYERGREWLWWQSWKRRGL